MNVRRLIGGLSFLCLLAGALLLCFIFGGFLNHYPDAGITLDRPGHIVGFSLIGLGAVGLVVLWSLEKKP